MRRPTRQNAIHNSMRAHKAYINFVNCMDGIYLHLNDYNKKKGGGERRNDILYKKIIHRANSWLTDSQPSLNQLTVLFICIFSEPLFIFKKMYVNQKEPRDRTKTSRYKCHARVKVLPVRFTRPRKCRSVIQSVSFVSMTTWNRQNFREIS